MGTPHGEPAAEFVDPIPQAVLTPSPGEEAEVTWREATRSIFETRPVGDPAAFNFRTRVCMIDGVLFDHTAFSASTYQRTGQHLRGSERDYVTIHLPLRGSEQGFIHDEPFTMGPDRITVLDWAHRFSTQAHDTEKLGVVIPRSRLARADRLYEQHPVLQWPVDSPAGRVFAGSIQSVWEQLPVMNPGDAREVVCGLVGLLDGLIAAACGGPSPMDSGSTGGSMLRAMKRYLFQHLEDPELGPDHLVSAFGCSRSTVYRLFQPHQGVNAYLRSVRLQKCFDAIQGGATTPEQVFEMRSRLGFKSASQFRRAFSQAFGTSPREMFDAITQHRQHVDRLAGQIAGGGQHLGVIQRWLSD